MSKPKTKEPLPLAMAKLILTVGIIVGVSAIMGVLGYFVTKPKLVLAPEKNELKETVGKIEISSDGKSIQDAKTKEVMLWIDATKKYLKDSGYEYSADTFQTTDAKYMGECFLDAALSNKGDKIVFSSGCLPGDLPQAWIGVHKIFKCPKNVFCDTIAAGQVQFLAGGSGRDFVWSEDDKTITYEADLGLSGLTEKRTIDSETGRAVNGSSEKNGMIKISGDELSGYVYLKDNLIYADNEIRGFITGDKINIYLGDKTASFKGDMKKILFHPAASVDWNFYYDTLEISNTFGMPSRKIDMNKITYKCDGSLFGGKIPNFYCKTNGRDFLSQYEFSNANGNGFTTGGGYTESWYKLYIRKINGVNYVFIRSLKGDVKESDDKYGNIKKYNDEYERISSKKYLDEILTDKENINTIKEADNFVEKINITEKDETANWKTYRNEKYRFEVKYPKDFEEEKLLSDSSLLKTTKKDGGGSYYFSVIVMKNYKIDRIVSSVKDAKEINVGGQAGYGYFYTEGAGKSAIALVQKGQDALSVSFDSIGNGKNFATAEEEKAYIQGFLNQMLSTFKFTETEN